MPDPYDNAVDLALERGEDPEAYLRLKTGDPLQTLLERIWNAQRFAWESTFEGWYVSEHAGALKTGPFDSQIEACSWFREELSIELPNG